MGGGRFLIVDSDARYGAWLRHHIGALWPGAEVRVTDPQEFERMGAALTQRDVDLVLLGASFGEEPDSPDSAGLAVLRRLREQPDLPPILALAEDGNELTAVRALRLGAADYVPKRLLTATRLAMSLRIALRVHSRLRETPAARAACPPTVQPAAPAAGRNDGEAAGAPRADAADAEPAPSQVIPRYTILQLLGESDKAVVYLAHSDELERNVALKVSRRQVCDDAEARRVFAREYAAIAALRHPSIVDIFDYGMHGGHEYLAMEYFPSGDLRARLRRPISEAESLGMLQRIAMALRVVHAAGLVHRDLKPPNVMLRESGEIVLIDFGLACSAEQGGGSTRTGMLRGSPYYMSPEQAEGRTLDGRTDLYSLGVMFYEMLTGRKPYTGHTAMEVLEQHVSAPVPRLPEPLAHHQPLLERLMAKQREQRIGSVEELLLQLGEPLDGAPAVMEPQIARAG